MWMDYEDPKRFTLFNHDFHYGPIPFFATFVELLSVRCYKYGGA